LITWPRHFIYSVSALTVALSGICSNIVKAECQLDAKPNNWTMIHTIQGSDQKSRFENRTVATGGVVTAVFESLRGYSIQNPDQWQDRKPSSSEGLFVYAPGQVKQVKVGQLVEVSGLIKTFHGMTQLKQKDLRILCPTDGLALVQPQPMPAKLDAATESMWLHGENLTVAQTQALYQYGTFSIALGHKNQAFVLVDDGSNASRPKHPFGTATRAIVPGASIAALDGVVFYSFDQYRLHLRYPKALQIEPGTNSHQLQSKPQDKLQNQHGLTLSDTSIRVLSLNTRNFFNGEHFANSRQERQRISFANSRGPQSTLAFEAKRDRLVALIEASNADIIALQEVENDIDEREPAIKALIAALKGSYQLTSKQTNGYGGDKITQYILLRNSTKLKAIGYLRSFTPKARNGDPHSGRPALAQQFEFTVEHQQARFWLATSHLKSKRNSCGPDRACVEKRLGQAQDLSRELTQLQQGKVPVLWVGDFNSKPYEPTMQFLAEHWQALLPDSAYSYMYRGRPELIDHALWLAPTESSWKPTASVWHVFNVQGVQQNYDESASDHDPILIELQLIPPSKTP